MRFVRNLLPTLSRLASASVEALDEVDVEAVVKGKKNIEQALKIVVETLIKVCWGNC